MGYIYTIKSKIDKKSYVGQTIRPIQKRLEEHRLGQSSGCRRIYNAIRKYGWENFEIYWYECPDEDLNEHEEFLVEVLDTLSPNGYNLKGGGGNRGKHSEETKQKNREAHLGEKSYWYGKTRSEETKQKSREKQLGDKGYWYGKSMNDKSKQKNREAHLGDKNPMYGKTGEKNPNSKRVYQYDLEGNLLGSFGTAGEAGIHLKKSGNNISRCACGDRKTAFGFKWSYIKTTA